MRGVRWLVPRKDSSICEAQANVREDAKLYDKAVAQAELEAARSLKSALHALTRAISSQEYKLGDKWLGMRFECGKDPASSARHYPGTLSRCHTLPYSPRSVQGRQALCWRFRLYGHSSTLYPFPEPSLSQTAGYHRARSPLWRIDALRVSTTLGCIA